MRIDVPDNAGVLLFQRALRGITEAQTPLFHAFAAQMPYRPASSNSADMCKPSTKFAPSVTADFHVGGHQGTLECTFHPCRVTRSSRTDDPSYAGLKRPPPTALRALTRSSSLTYRTRVRRVRSGSYWRWLCPQREVTGVAGPTGSSKSSWLATSGEQTQGRM